jgi:hypothetical protein
MEPSWNKVQDVQQVLNRCPCLEEWFDVFVTAEPVLKAWKDRLGILVTSKGVDIAEQLVQQVDVGPEIIEVPTKFAWAMALNHTPMLGEEDFGRLMTVSLRDDQELSLAVVVTSLLGTQKLIIAKRHNDVRVWLDQEDDEKKESVLKWVNDTYAETKSKMYHWYSPTVIAAWVDDLLDAPDA